MPVRPSSAAPLSRGYESASVEELFRHLQPILGAAARRVLAANDPEYEDVLQSALERVFASLCDERLERDTALRSWAIVITRNVAIDHLRLRCRERRIFGRDDVAEVAPNSDVATAQPERVAHARRELGRFMEALARLPPRSARVVYMHDVLGHELAHISATIGMSVSAAQSRLVRGRRRINDELDLDPQPRRTPRPPPPNAFAVQR